MVGAGVGLVYDERMCAHENLDDPFHPETPARITSIFTSLKSAGIVERCERVEARDATPAELASVHTEEHIAKMCAVSSKKYGKGRRAALACSYSSIYFNEGSSNSALLAAGSVVEVSLRVARGDLRAAAAIVRPPGHHAEAGAAMGFCLFNNVAVAAHVLVHGHPDLGIRKVLIVDWDVHHGNGTQHMFWRDPQVLYFSIHRHDFGQFYPGGNDGNYDKIGEDSGSGFNINVPWPHDGYGDLDYLAVFDHVLMPVAQEFKPDLVLVSGGFDSASGDPLGCCEVTPAGYSQMTNRLMGLANGRVVLALEGGYNLKSISDSYLACMEVLLGEQPKKITSTKHHISSTLHLVKEVRCELQEYWTVLSTTKDEADSMLHNKGKLDREEPKLEFSESGRSALFPADLVSSPTAGGQSGDPNLLVEAFNNALSLDPDSSEVTKGSVDNRHLAKKDVGIGDGSIAGDLEAGYRLIGEPNFSPPIPVETCPVANIDGHQENSGVDCKTDEDNLESDQGNKATKSGGEDFGNHVATLSQDGGIQDVDKIEGSDLAASVMLPPDRKDPEKAYVWYACYASNMWAARFMCYIKGGQVEGMTRGCIGARDQAPPIASRWVKVPHSLFFGRSWTSTWGSGGVAFLDPVSHGGPPTTQLRLYKITLQQLCDLLTQENGGDPKISELSIEWDRVKKLQDSQSAASHSTFDFLEETWYGTIKYLGDEDGLPMLTITCSLKDMQKFREGQLQICPPSEAYRTAIFRGLMENELLSAGECEKYIASRSRRL